MAYTFEQRADLKRACTTIIPGHTPLKPGEEFIRIGEWCRAHGYDADVYGVGKLLNDLNQNSQTAR